MNNNQKNTKKIAEETGATVITRGVYKPPHSTTDERALHLYIEAPSQESLNKAVEAINKIIKEPKVNIYKVKTQILILMINGENLFLEMI